MTAAAARRAWRYSLAALAVVVVVVLVMTEVVRIYTT